MRTTLVGAVAPAAVTESRPGSARYHFYHGNDSSRWVTDQVGHHHVVYERMLRGVDLVYRVDTLENAIVALSTRVRDGGRLLSKMKKATARDFRIQHSEVANKLKHLERAARAKEGKKRAREADKATPPTVAAGDDESSDDEEAMASLRSNLAAAGAAGSGMPTSPQNPWARGA